MGNQNNASVRSGKRPGLKPGQRHSGQFKSGHDPRRKFSDAVHVNGQTLSAMARDFTPECLMLMVAVVRGVDDQGQEQDYKIADRLRASEFILNRGWGTAVQNIELSLHDSRPIAALSRTELLALARGEQPRLPVLLDAVPSEAQEEEGAVSDC